MERFTELLFRGAKATNGTLDNAVAVDATGGKTTIPITAHGLIAGSMVHIAGSVAYDGNYEVLAVAANSITVKAPYVAEEFVGTETFVSGWKMGKPGAVAGIVAHINAGVAAPELMSLGVDADRGADLDFTLDSHDFNTVIDWVEMYDPPIPYEANDIIQVTFANSTSKAFGVRVFITD